MITFDSLLEEAKRLNLPLHKKRAILREYLQVLVLNTLYKHKLGNKVYFMGGTALRFFYKLPRFSEDLDFNASGLSSSEFNSLLSMVTTALRNEGLKVKVNRKDIYDVYSAGLIFESVMKTFSLMDKRGEDIIIKIEANSPVWQMNYEPRALSYFGFLFTALLMNKGALFAEKSHAFIKRCRGRDVYDMLYMLRLKFPIDKEMFKAKKIEGDPKDVLLNKFTGLKETELKNLSKQVRPFLFNEDEVEFVEKAPFYGQQLLQDYIE